MSLPKKSDPTFCRKFYTQFLRGNSDQSLEKSSDSETIEKKILEELIKACENHQDLSKTNIPASDTNNITEGSEKSATVESVPEPNIPASDTGIIKKYIEAHRNARVEYNELYSPDKSFYETVCNTSVSDMIYFYSPYLFLALCLILVVYFICRKSSKYPKS